MQVVTDRKQAANMCKLAALAYQETKIVTCKLQREFPESGIHFISDGFLVAEESQMIIALKGIGSVEEYASKRKLFDDNALVPAPFSIPGKTHKGLTEIAESLFQNLIPSIHNHKSLVVVGHSLGGGIGLLLGALFATEGCHVQVYTFGTPKVGSQQFVDWFDQNVGCCSTIIEGDPIPSWPTLPVYAKITYGHVLKGFGKRQFMKIPNGIEGISDVEIQTHSIFSYVLATKRAADQSG